MQTSVEPVILYKDVFLNFNVKKTSHRIMKCLVFCVCISTVTIKQPLPYWALSNSSQEALIPVIKI